MSVTIGDRGKRRAARGCMLGVMGGRHSQPPSRRRNARWLKPWFHFKIKLGLF